MQEGVKLHEPENDFRGSMISNTKLVEPQRKLNSTDLDLKLMEPSNREQILKAADSRKPQVMIHDNGFRLRIGKSIEENKYPQEPEGAAEQVPRRDFSLGLRKNVCFRDFLNEATKDRKLTHPRWPNASTRTRYCGNQLIVMHSLS